MSRPAELVMDKPVGHSLLDRGAGHLIGAPLDRKDGPLKVSGTATYAAEYPLENLAYGVLVGAPIGAGQVESVDAGEAEALPGVIAVVTDFDTFIRNPAQGGDTQAPTQGVRDIAYFNQPVAVAVADSLEAARDAAERVLVRVKPAPGRFDFEAHLRDTEKPDDVMIPAHSVKGDLERAMAEAAVTVDSTWITPSQNSAAMEPHAAIAEWQDDRLVVHASYQMLSHDREQLADALGLPVDKVRIVSRYVGGGFGSKLGISAESVCAAIAARRIGRPVKVVMTRQNVLEATVRRSNTRQRIRLAADPSGRVTGIGHETIVSNLPGEDFFEPAGLSTHFLYRGENRKITHDLVRMNWLLAASMRAPGEAAGMLALEAAMDELAEKVGVDPVELRRRNEPEQDPGEDKPFSTRQLVRCLDHAAERFGWAERNRTPGRQREGDWLIGHGMAVAARGNLLQRSEARVSLTTEGALVETDMTDIGTGTYTILGQIAGEMLGLPMERVEVRLGDTDLPAAAGSGGSWGAASSGSSVYLACRELRDRIAEAMQCPPDALTLKDGHAVCANRSVPLSAFGELSAEGRIRPGAQSKERRQASYGAHFCEVGVHRVTGEVRVRRWVASFTAGRILNEKTARSQCIGGIVFGIGAALSEELVHDPRSGKVVNRDLAEYHVPVHADIPAMDITFLPELDPHANPLQAKGIGELSISGAGAAVANAIYNATGVRVRDYPITLEKLLQGLPPV